MPSRPGSPPTRRSPGRWSTCPRSCATPTWTAAARPACCASAWSSTRSAAHVAEENVPVYAVVPRGLLSDGDLTSNERMVVRRWADDGMVEVVRQSATGCSRWPNCSACRCSPRSAPTSSAAGPWVDEPGRLLAAVPGAGGPVLVARVGRERARPRRARRRWARSCSPGCGAARSRTAAASARRRRGQPVRRHAHGHQPGGPAAAGAACRRADLPAARRQAARRRRRARAVEVLSVRIDGVVRQRFVVAADQPVVVGRAPEGGGGIMLGQWLTEDARKWISRGHVQIRRCAAANSPCRTSAPTARASARAARRTTTSGSRWPATRPARWARPTWSSSMPGVKSVGPREVGHRRRAPADLGDGRGPDHGDPPSSNAEPVPAR